MVMQTSWKDLSSVFAEKPEKSSVSSLKMHLVGEIPFEIPSILKAHGGYERPKEATVGEEKVHMVLDATREVQMIQDLWNICRKLSYVMRNRKQAKSLSMGSHNPVYLEKSPGVKRIDHKHV